MNNIDCGLIIRRQGNKRSESYAKICADSLEFSNMKHEYIDAVQNVDYKTAASQAGLTFTEEQFNKSKELKNSVAEHPECMEMGNACCTASHVKAWRRVVEIDKPCAILEHDAYVYKNFRNFEIPEDVLVHLGPRMRDTKTYVPRGRVRRLIRIPQSIGTHGYAITPKTAQKLIDGLESAGMVYGVDHYLFMSNACGLDIIAADPYPLICWSRESTMGDTPEHNPGFRGVWAGQNDQNVPGQITPGLVEGLGCPLHG